MTDGAIVTLIFNFRPEAVEPFCAALPDMLKETSKRPGFRSIRIVRRPEEPNQVLFIEHWDNAEAYQGYVAWRTERGEMDGLDAVLTGPMQLTIWPTLVTKA
jgi:quinol monooxygenase YgiN